MKRAQHSFSLLQAIAAIVAAAIILWSLGLQAIHFAEAANVTTYSDTLSTSEPSVVANHTITFSAPSGVANGDTVTIDFSDGPFVVGSVDYTDIDVSTQASGDLTVEGTCTTQEVSAAFSGTDLVITFCSGNGASVAANGTTTIEIGTNATSETTGDQQLTNPGAGSYQIPITTSTGDSGETRVAITSVVNVTASVDTVFDFTVTGVSAGQLVNTADTTGGATLANSIPFGVLDADTASTAAQGLEVSTNAANGFVVTVVADGQLESATGADIDGYQNGNYTTTPTAWAAPGGTLGSEETYGHWGVSSDDTTLTSGLSDLYSGGDNFVSASTTPVEVFRHDGPANGTTAGVGTTTVIYKVETSALQEAAEDYTAVLTYIATPVF